jgi:hypothetical protein
MALHRVEFTLTEQQHAFVKEQLAVKNFLDFGEYFRSFLRSVMASERLQI